MIRSDARQVAPAAARNREPILAVLRRILPARGLVLEIASGTGEHVTHFAAALPVLTFQPSDPDPEMRASIAAWTAEAGLANLLPPLDIDVRRPDWSVERADALLCINMVHISPRDASEALIAGAATRLPPDGVLYLYGPYHQAGRELAPSNAAFDAALRARNPAWGIRDLEAITGLAEASGFALAEVVDMPANNLSVVFRRR